MISAVPELHRRVHLDASVILASSYFGYPLSTTQVVSGGVLGAARVVIGFGVMLLAVDRAKPTKSAQLSAPTRNDITPGTR